MEEILNWLKTAEKFAEDGDAESMMGVAEEILELNKNCAEGYAIMAESALYRDKLHDAEKFLAETFKLDEKNLRGRLVQGGVAAKNFQLLREFEIFDEVINDAKKLPDDFFAKRVLFKALCWSANNLYLAGNAAKAAENLREASTMTENTERAAELFSKHLFLKNYSSPPDKNLAQEFNKFFANVNSYEDRNYNHQKIKIGYISPDFRQHAVANFVQPLLKNFNAEKFSVTCYHTGETDIVTKKLQNDNIEWRDLQDVDEVSIAEIIRADEIDILVDLSGHSQNSCLPILAYRPAPIQITAIGYTATTGLKAVDYFLTDNICVDDNFTEKTLAVEGCQFCYAPFSKFPNIKRIENNFVTFGCFNNFAKVTDEVLTAWKEILEAVPNSKLVIKNKLSGIRDGRKILIDKLRSLDFPSGRVALRSYSENYLEDYNTVDIALDTFPYNGGLTTCEALYMGVPVITLRGNWHGAKIGASILTAAGLPELVAKDSADYVKKAILIARHKNFYKNLREKILNSDLMNGEKYMAELEKVYLSVYKQKWNAF